LTDPLKAALEKAVEGRYRVERELGRGGMGAVFLAHDPSLDREVAIKVLPPELAVQPALRERFVREAKLAASLSHPNIIHVHAVEEHGDVLAIVMQYVDGETLTERVARAGPYDAPDVAKLLQDTAWALGYAHARGIVHRDVKPDNLMIERGTGRALIMDFGIARKEKASNLTEVGHSIGTPSYMSPEQAAAEQVDGRSDLYSLGCVGFFAATGRPPFEAESAHKLLIQHLTVAAPAITSIRSNFPEKLAGVVAQALEKEPAKRFTTGEAMADAIGALQLRGREIAPLLRLFHQQTAQSLQSLLMLVIVYAIFFQFAPSARTLLGAMIAVLFASVAGTVLSQTLDRVRFAVRRGFTVADVESAFETIADETVRGRDQLLGDPVERARINRRKRIAMAGGFVGGMTLPIVLRIVNLAPEGRKGVGTTGGLLLLGGTVLIGISIGLWNMRPVRITLAQRAAHRIWSSSLGRALFARAQRRYARELERAAARVPAA
jgi:predicted Ser/Thr protein kinase